MNSTRPAESRSTSSFLSLARSASASGLFSWWRMRVRLSRLETVTPVSIPAICAQVGIGREGLRRLLAKDVERLLQRGRVGQRHARAHGLRGAGDQRLDVVEIVGDQQAGERQVGERRVAGPGAQHAGDAAVLEPRAVSRHDVIHAAQDHRDVRSLFACCRSRADCRGNAGSGRSTAPPAAARASAA